MTQSVLVSERVIQDGLCYEFAQLSPSVVVKLYGEGEKFHAVVRFKKYVVHYVWCELI